MDVGYGVAQGGFNASVLAGFFSTTKDVFRDGADLHAADHFSFRFSGANDFCDLGIGIKVAHPFAVSALGCQGDALGSGLGDFASLRIYLQGNLAQSGAVLVGLDHRAARDFAVVGLVGVAREDRVDLVAGLANELAIGAVFFGNICALIASGTVVGQQHHYICLAVRFIAIGELLSYTVRCFQFAAEIQVGDASWGNQ
ncbi:hypothetical protein D3C74_179980 [compost metagenome]